MSEKELILLTYILNEINSSLSWNEEQNEYQINGEIHLEWGKDIHAEFQQLFNKVSLKTAKFFDK